MQTTVLLVALGTLAFAVALCASPAGAGRTPAYTRRLSLLSKAKSWYTSTRQSCTPAADVCTMFLAPVGFFASACSLPFDFVKTRLQKINAKPSYTYIDWVLMSLMLLSLPSGFFASACSLPFDFVKTRLQKMTPNPDGTMPYKGPMDCAMQTLKQEGPLKFYTGFPTYLVR